MKLGEPRSDRMAMGMCLLYAIVFAAQIWASPNHATSFDSEQYLLLARRIIEGRWIPTIDQQNALGRAFNPYGLGYPYLIALFSFWGWLPLLLASKLVNLALVGSGLWRLGRQLAFAGAGQWVALSAPFLLLTTHTWSEAAMVGLALHFAAEIRLGRMLALSVLIVLIRHQGLFLVVGIGLSHLLTSRISLWQCVGLIAAALGIDLAYLGIEASQSRMLSGGSRPGASLDIYSFINEAVVVSIHSFAWVAKGRVLLMVSGLAGLGMALYCGSTFLKKATPFAQALVAGGLLYLAGTLPMLYFFAFSEGIDLRLLGPGWLLIQMGLLSQVDLKALPPSRSLLVGAALAIINLPWQALLNAFTN